MEKPPERRRPELVEIALEYHFCPVCPVETKGEHPNMVLVDQSGGVEVHVTCPEHGGFVHWSNTYDYCWCEK